MTDSEKAKTCEIEYARIQLKDFDTSIEKVPITVLIERAFAWQSLIEKACDNYRNELKRIGYTEHQLREIGHK